MASDPKKNARPGQTAGEQTNQHPQGSRPAAVRTPLPAEITDWRPFTSNTMRGLFSVLLPSGMLFHGCSLHVAEDGRAWISLPSKVRVSNGHVSTYLGKPVYDKVVEVPDRDRRDALQASILTALAAHPQARHELPAGGVNHG